MKARFDLHRHAVEDQGLRPDPDIVADIRLQLLREVFAIAKADQLINFGTIVPPKMATQM